MINLPETCSDYFFWGRLLEKRRCSADEQRPELSAADSAAAWFLLWWRRKREEWPEAIESLASEHTVDGCEILHQLIGGLSHHRGLTIQSGAGFLPATVLHRNGIS